MSKKRKKVDTDYFPSNKDENDEDIVQSRKVDFLAKNSKDIFQLNQDGNGPTKIAEMLCVKNGLTVGSITGKKVTNWLRNHKNAGIGKFRPVSLQNNNLRMNESDCK